MEDNFSQKEILQELMRETKAQSNVLATLAQKAISIEEQVKKTNGRVNGHDTAIGNLEKKQENLGVKVAAGVFVATVLASIAFNKFIASI